MSDLIDRIRPLIDMCIPTDWLMHAIARTTRYTDTEKEQAMQYVIRNADIGETEEIEIVEVPEPVEVPQPEEEPVPA